MGANRALKRGELASVPTHIRMLLTIADLRKRRHFSTNLDSERSASQFTLKAYGHDLEKFQEFLAPKLRQGYLPGDVTQNRTEITNGRVTFMLHDWERKGYWPSTDNGCTSLLQ